MLNFRPLKKEDFPIVSPRMYEADFGTTESSFVTLYMWKDLYNCEICIDGGDVFFRSVGEDFASYLFPYADDLRSAMDKIYEAEEARGSKSVKLHSVTDEMKRRLAEAFGDEISFTERRKSFDYIYSSEALSTLSGKKLHQKRNHVNKFEKKYEGRYTYLPLVKEDTDEVLAFQKKWAESAKLKNGAETLEYESGAIEKLFENFEEFSLLGGVLRIDGEIVAYCLANRVCRDVIGVMVEKADYMFDGAYQMINKCFATQVRDTVKYLNREDDLGIEGLRRAKLSYYPETLIRKYNAVWKRK